MNDKNLTLCLHRNDENTARKLTGHTRVYVSNLKTLELSLNSTMKKIKVNIDRRNKNLIKSSSGS